MKNFKRILTSALAFVMAASCINGSFVNEVKAAGTVSITNENNVVTVSNEYISREFSIAGDKVTTTKLTNKRANTEFVPAEGSMEFYVNLCKSDSEPTITVEAIDRTGWTASVNSWQNNGTSGDASADALLDASTDTYWHSGYNASAVQNKADDEPFIIIINFNDTETFKSWSWVKRPTGNNGDLEKVNVYVSNSSTALDASSSDWEQVLTNAKVEYASANTAYINMNEETTATQMKIEVVASTNGFASGADFNLHAEKVEAVARGFSSDELTLENVTIEDTTNTINGVEKSGKMVTFDFAPYTYKEATFDIDQVVVMYEGDHFMRKFLEISIDEDHKATTAIDYIDLDRLAVNASDATWTIPHVGGIVAMEEFLANLGQPFYVQGMFMGSEFPETQNEIVDGIGLMRYYTGKTFADFERDGQLTTEGKYVTWQTVYGAARSTEQDVIKADFFDYIYTIATPSEFRLQYNSWFDNMMTIDDESIKVSFIENDKNFSFTETRPYDSYVVDDGWNNYHYDSVFDIPRSGTTLNQTGFWEFNSKFPEGFTPSSQLVAKFGSYFGVWVGPRGGYNYQGSIANILVRSGKGSKAGGSIDVADRTYLKYFTEMVDQWQTDYKINYWKWDGFADGSQYGQWAATDGVPSRENNHMVGGYKHMYHVTDLWEGWIQVMEDARESADRNDIYRLWFSITCYVNPSPWFLQWANSVWLQCVYDQVDSGASSSKMDRQLTYRDGMYYDFSEVHQFQFPFMNIMNHDPIYGKTGTNMTKNNVNAEQLQNYFYAYAMRGSAFWELYLSDSLMDEDKYEVIAESVEWGENNYHILKNAKMFGGHPNNNLKLDGGPNYTDDGNAYGFSAFDGSDGLISFRNPLTTNTTISLTFDRNIGVPEDTDCVYYIEHKYEYTGSIAQTGEFKYGETYEFELGPDEHVIVRVSEEADTTAPVIKRVYASANNTIEVKFDQKVEGTGLVVEGVEVESVVLNADDISYTITTAEDLTDNTVYTVSTNTVATLAVEEANVVVDKAGNVADSSKSFTFYTDNKAYEAVKGETVAAEDSLTTDFGFTVEAEVSTNNTGVLVAQGDSYKLGINEDGTAYFEVNGAKAESGIVVNDGELYTVSGVLENNGMVKVYVNGEIAGAKYKAENRYYEVEAADVTVSEIDGLLNVQTSSISLGYDEVASDDSASTERTPLELTGENCTSTDESTEDAEVSDLANLFDGDPTTFWASEPVSQITADSPYVIVDLGAEKVIDRVDYTKRYYDGPQNQWKCTGNIRKYVIATSTDGENFDVVAEGDTFADEDYTTKADGGTTEITFEPTTARYVRISATESYHWQESNLNTVLTIGDLAIYEWHYVAPELDANNLINKAANEVEVESYSSQCGGEGEPTENGYGQASTTVDYNNDSYWHSNWSTNNGEQHTITYDLGKSYSVTDVTFLPRQEGRNGDIHKFEVYVGDDTDYTNNTLTGEYVFAEDGTLDPEQWYRAHLSENGEFEGRYVTIRITGSYGDSGNNKFASMAEIRFYGTTDEEETGVDKSALEKLVHDAAEIDQTLYTEESAAALLEAIISGEAVLNSEAATQETVNQAIANIEEAIEGLELKPAAPTVDKAALVKAITDAKAVDTTKYTEATVTVLTTALTAAESVNADENATQEAVDAAVKALTDAIDSLEEKPATPQPEPKPTMDFYDVQDKSAWFYGSVEKAFQKGLMLATGKAPVDGKPWFEPDTNISRGMVATVLYRMAGQPKVEFKATFKDVTNANLWYSTAITWAAQNGVVSGYKDGRFGPDDNITRQDLAIMLRNYAKAAGLDTNVTVDFAAFKDGKQVVDYAQSAVAWCVEAKLMSGSVKADGTYLMPTANATRAECAKMFSLLDDAIKANAK